MNRNAVKTFAQWGRRHLHDLIRARLALFGVTDKGILTPTRIQGGLIIDRQTLTLSISDIGQYDALITHHLTLPGSDKEKFNLLVDEIGYTWFNRLAALRYMEVHGYVERALSSDTPGVTDPNLLRDAMTLAAQGDLPHVTPDVLAEWQRLYTPGEVYRRLLVAQAAAFESALPFLFGRDKAWLDLFLPDNLLNQDSFVRRMVSDIPEEDWQDIEIVGWLYQFYISERKDEVFAQKGKYTPRDIPAATQLFTPHWIVRYMVENSLGRVWLEAHPDSKLREQMPYYLESENPAPPANPDLTPEQLTVMDPACGSGHILVYAFDLLTHIYREQGYSDRDIPALIVEHNLHGLDIDERAAQLASFAVMMKARALNSRLFRDTPSLNVLQVRPTRGLRLPQAGSKDMFGRIAALSGGLSDAQAFNPNDWQPLVDAFADADHLGSLITPPNFDAGKLQAQLDALESGGGLDAAGLDDLRHLLKQAELLAKKYDAVVANPPYMENSNFNQILFDYTLNRYNATRQDLYAVFMEMCLRSAKKASYVAIVNRSNWMFMGDYLTFRDELISNIQISTLVHLGHSVFPDLNSKVVQVAAFVLRNDLPSETGLYIKLVDVEAKKKEEEFHNKELRYKVKNQEDYRNIPGHPVVYWATQPVFDAYHNFSILSSISEPRQGFATGNNDRFLKLWHEVPRESSKMERWQLCQKGGEFRRWYGNLDHVVDWNNNGQDLIQFEGSVMRNQRYYFRSGVTWSTLSSSDLSMRYSPKNVLFESKGSICFPIEEDDNYTIISFGNSKVANHFLKMTSPTLDYHEGPMSRLPLFKESRSHSKAAHGIEISKTDWDNYETSRDFTTHPLLRPQSSTLAEAFSTWQAQAEAAFRELQRLEEENNRYWIEAYGLGNELTPEVPDDQITIRRADLSRDAKSLLSYAVGCMMGRYSLDEPGLIHAGQPIDPSRHTSFPADRDGILPVTLGDYFDDDVTARFIEFLRVAFAPERVAENLEWVAMALGGQKAGETAEARVRRYFATEFMSDHLQTYKKRPIYWLYTSGKKRGFGALVYLHRADSGTLARLRTDYLMPLQRKLDAELDRATAERDAAGSTAAKTQAGKRMKDISEQIAEVHKYDESLKHAADLKISLDLDDGVAYNYWLMSAAGQAYLTGWELKGGQDLVYTGTDLKMADLEKKSQWKRDLLAQNIAQAPA
jgi:type II restriction/modification system DNA methylase subunit YeeA